MHPKVQASAGAGALAGAILYVAHNYFGVELPVEVVTAFVVFVSTLFAYFVPSPVEKK